MNKAATAGVNGQAGASTEGEGGTSGEASVPDDIFDMVDKIDREEDEDDPTLKTVSFEVNQDHIEVIQKR